MSKMQNFKKYSTKAAAWIMSVMMVITGVNLPSNVIVSAAEEDVFEVTETEETVAEDEENVEDEIISEDEEVKEDEIVIEEEVTEDETDIEEEEITEDEIDIEEDETAEDEIVSEDVELTEDEIVAEDEELTEDEIISEEEISDDEPVVEDESVEGAVPMKGKMLDVSWEITEDGELILTGYGDYKSFGTAAVDPEWCADEYVELITSATVDLAGSAMATDMFKGLKNLKTVDFTKFDMSKVVNTSYMFLNCESLESVDFTGTNASKVVNTSYMFSGCKSLEKVNFSGFSFKDSCDSQSMFSDCQSLETLDLSGCDVSNISTATEMFSNCFALKNINLNTYGEWKPNMVFGMFTSCSSLESLDLSNVNLENVSSEMGFMYFLSGCTGLQYIRSPYNNKFEIELPPVSNAPANWFDENYNQTDAIPVADASHLFVKYNSDVWSAHITESNTNITEDIWVGTLGHYQYTGKAIKPKVSVFDGPVRLTEGKDYKLTYKNNKNYVASTSKKQPSVTVTGIGNYKFKVVKNFAIVPATLANADWWSMPEILTFTGKDIKPVPKLSSDAKLKPTKKDYTVSYYKAVYNSASSKWDKTDSVKALKEAGNYIIELTGKKNFSGKVQFHVSVQARKDLSKVKVTNIPVIKVGVGIAPSHPVVKDGKKIIAESEYIIENFDEEAFATTGKKTATIKAKDTSEYFGSKTFTYTVTGTSIKGGEVTFPETLYYVYVEDGYKPTFTLKVGGKTLTKGTDYTAEFKNNKNAGKITVIITGIGTYSGTIKTTVKIPPRDISSVGVLNVFLNGNKAVDGEKNPVFFEKGGVKCDVKVESDLLFIKETLKNGKDYTLSFKNNKALGTATVTVKGKGNYKGSKSVDFEIVAKPLYKVNVDVKDVKYKYDAKNGNYRTTLTLTDTNGKKLEAGKDYDKNFEYVVVSDSSNSYKTGDKLTGSENLKSGTVVRAIAKGKGSYSGTAAVSFRITDGDISKAKVKVKSQTYTGKSIIVNPKDITIKDGSKELVYGTDYAVIPGSYSNNVNKGTASFTIKGLNNYGGTKKVTFKITQQIFNFAK